MKDEKFSWVETHQKITQYLSTKENSQQDLIDLLKSVGIGPFNDKAGSGEHDIELDEIDPFTFYCYIYKYGTKRRLKYLQDIATNLNIEKPSGESGIPSAQAQKVWLFPYKYERNNNEVSRLWNLFNKELKGEITDQDFSDALLIRSTGKTKLTEALFYIKPEKYLPINGPTKPYIKEVLGIDPKFNTYTEYLEILSEIREKISIPFYELSYEAWKWNDERKKVNYWVFQGNPKVFDFETALRAEILTDWTVSAHKDKIKVGDKVILWITGDQSGCYALAEVTSEPHQKTTSPDDHLWKGEDKSSLKADIKIIHNLVDKPILSEEIAGTEELSNLKVGNQGTNFSATEEEYQAILDLSQNNNEKQYWLYAPGENAHLWDEFYQDGIMGLGWDEIGDLSQYKSRDEIKKALVDAYRGKGSKKNDVSANDDFLNKIMIGDVIIAKKGRGELLGYGIVKSDYFFDKKRENYQKTRKVDWKLTGNWKVDFSLVLKTLTDITKYKSDHPDYSKYYERLLGIMGQNNKIEKKEEMNLPLNTILYGPPGTGKTHILKNQYMDMFTTSESSITRQDFLKDIIQNCSWWQVIALAVLDLGKTKVADIFNHEYVQVKAQLSNSTTVTPTIWGQLQSHTVEDCEHVKVSRRMPPMIFNKTEKSEWEILQNEVEEQSPELLELKSKIENFESIPNKRIERYEFLTFHQSYSYEDFIEGIKPELAESDVSYKIEEGVFQKMCNRARNDSSNNYAIFIDEINRGNISSIFGELITLIEDDKREGKPNEIIATLPYSKKHFSVPKNLYIIGTMNTADRSVEALDTALRRRFSFIEMNPEPKKLGAEEFKCTGIDLEALLNAINARIEKLLDKDYCIGHSYFMSIKNRQSPLEEMKSIFQNKILPLLQEYFYGDWGKILLVIGGEFVESRKSTIKFLSTDRYEDFEEYDEKPIYNFTNPSSWTLDSFKSIYE
jgi:Cdc6-like AAA superfamily ATPase